MLSLSSDLVRAGLKEAKEHRLGEMSHNLEVSEGRNLRDLRLCFGL